MSLYDNLQKIRERVDKASRSAGRSPSEITLVAVTKKVDLKLIREAVKGGVRVLGGNYIQESEESIERLKRSDVRWHFIGKLQKNKVKVAVELFDVIETVDSLKLAAEISKRAARPIDVLLQINMGDEATKGGVSPAEASELAAGVATLKNINLKGLMTIPPRSDTPEVTRGYFTTLRRTAERINSKRIPGVNLSELSMGMSSDFEIAIEEGATIIRVGRALFGEREG